MWGDIGFRIEGEVETAPHAEVGAAQCLLVGTDPEADANGASLRRTTLTLPRTIDDESAANGFHNIGLGHRSIDRYGASGATNGAYQD